MKALRFDGNSLDLVDVMKPVSSRETLVRVVKSGICGTDLEIINGYSGFTGTLGHEFVGVVESSADAPEIVGKRVVGEINVGCGICELCVAGDPRHCSRRTVLGIFGRDGAHAEYLLLPARNLFEVSDSISDDAAVFVEPLAAAIGISERTSFKDGSAAAVIGDGRLGILCARVLAVTQPTIHVTLIGKHKDKLGLKANGAIETILLADARILEDQYDVVVEASGQEGGFDLAMQIVRPRGAIVLKSTFHGLHQWEASRVVVDEISIIGSRCGQFEPALKLLAGNQIVVEDLISGAFPLSDGEEAFKFAEKKGTLKVLLDMDG